MWKDYYGRIVGTSIGFLLAFIFLFSGFWAAIIAGLFIGAGYLAGRYVDGKADVKRMLNKFIAMILNK